MYKAVVLGNLKYVDGFVVGDGMSAFGLYQVVGHVAHADTPVAIVVGAAFVEFLASVAARADADGKMSLVAFKPVGDMLYVGSLILHGYCFLHGDDMHAYAAAAHRYHGGNLLQRQESHTLKEHCQLRMLVHQLHVHIGVLGAARDEHRHPVFAVFALEGGARHRTVLGVVVAVVVLQHT